MNGKDRWALRTCTAIPFPFWQRLVGLELIIPYWHVVSDVRLPHISGLYHYRNIQDFVGDLEFLLRYYSPVTLKDVISYLRNGRALPRAAVLLTFDDGFRELHDVIAPLLRARGIPAAFFLTTAAIDNQHLCYPQKKSLLVEALSRQSGAALREAATLLSAPASATASDLRSRIRAVSYSGRDVLDAVAQVFQVDFCGYLRSARPYVSSEDVRSLLQQGFSVGAHSVDHPLYSELTLSEQLFQTRESMRWLSERFRVTCESFAFPFRDNGVRHEFFDAMFSEGDLKISFGTGGLIPHGYPYNLRRVPLGDTEMTAAEALVRQFGRHLVRWKLKHLFVRAH